eukprot:TRINITY_DN3795_c0_g1_i1.p1 TRINITY_DN3795_c0_g1~~TRINITY_DN3795_c0_g1_i1.p1  ORF type:complete len:217 (-),score=8.50 TRINITY_DN3795_c0_g1_i1:214-864(-)
MSASSKDRKRSRPTDAPGADLLPLEPVLKKTKTVDHDNEVEHLAAHHRHFFHIEAPTEWDGTGPSIFLAGGISNCADWQSKLAEKFANDCPNLVLLNPRRKNFDVADHSESERQIKWEFNHLRKASAILFWFPSETLCPITLFELGQWSALAALSGKSLFVGCDPQYQRKMDVEIQLSLIAPSVRVVQSLDALAELVCSWYFDRFQGSSQTQCAIQ